MDRGWCFFSDNAKDIVIEKESLEVKFNIKLTSKRGYVKEMDMVPLDRRAGVAMALKTGCLEVNGDNEFMEVHKKLGHACEKYTRNTIMKMSDKSVGIKKLNCFDCAMGKVFKKEFQRRIYTSRVHRAKDYTSILPTVRT